MSLRPWQHLLARLFFLTYVLFTAGYCLLAYIPFTYQQIHVGELLPWLTRLVHWHALLFWPAFAAALVTILPDLKTTGPARYLGLGFAASGALAGSALLIHPLLPGLKSDASSLRWSFIALLPLVWLAGIDWWRGSPLVAGQEENEDFRSAIFLASLETAGYSTTLCFLGAVFRSWSGNDLSFGWARWASFLVWSLLSQLLVFFLLFVLLDFVSLLAGLLPHTKAQSVASLAGSVGVIAALVALFVRFVVLPPFSLQAGVAAGVAIACAVSVVAFALGTCARLYDRNYSIASALDLLVVPLRFLRSVNWATRGTALLALAGVAWAASLRASRMDWEFLLQKILVAIVWAVAFALFYAIAPKPRWISRVVAYTAGGVILAAFLGLSAMQPRINRETGFPTIAGEALDEFEGYDISFRLVDEMLRPRPGSKSDPATASFYSFLGANTNIPRSTRLAPVDIRLVSKLTEAPGTKPDVFVIVIDSLRRDYLSPYNADVTFTPAIDRFASESVVFRNAFTRYGGTGLSEPSIWVGGLIAHQQYTTPFAPMNSLQKLMEVNHYREWISKDNVLQQVVSTSPNIKELDQSIGSMSYDLCRTLQEVTGRLGATGTPRDSVFVYTQAQNIHVSVIDREGRSVPKGVSFRPGFDAAYASRLQRIDACFGSFLDGLKKSNRYDNSIVVLTSDHGDSLGERGRWGHAYTIFPEIVRIPIIVHLPAEMRDKFSYDPQAVTFLTDLTPSLYYLLGEKPLLNSPLFGRPIFTDTKAEQDPYRRDSYVLASSYAPVYGLLSHNGRRLYVADGVNYRDYAFELGPGGGNRELPITEDERTEAQKKIREQVNAVASFYGLPR